jgi:hypothetical protein
VRRRLLAATAALVLLLAGTVVLVAYVRGADARALAGTRTVEVLVADQPIPEGTSGDALADLVRTEALPEKAAVAGRVTDLAALADQVATVDIQPGEQLLAGRFARPESLQAPGTVAVPAGKQELSVLLEPQRAVGSRLQAGDTVGVYVSLTLLNVLSSFIPEGERIVTIEDAVELQLQQEHVVRLESRPPNIEGKGAITIRDLVRNSLRMRPDRIVVGECRGGESLDMLQAMNTGHDGSLSTVHANSPRDAIARLETLVLMAGMDLPLRAIREQIASAVDVVVQLTRLRDGTRRVTHVTEVQGMEGETVTLQDAFLFDYSAGVDASGRFLGKPVPTGVRPRFTDRFTDLGITLSPRVFGIAAPARGGGWA